MITLGAGKGLEERLVYNNKNTRSIYKFSEEEIDQYPEELFNEEKVIDQGVGSVLGVWVDQPGLLSHADARLAPQQDGGPRRQDHHVCGAGAQRQQLPEARPALRRAEERIHHR